MDDIYVDVCDETITHTVTIYTQCIHDVMIIICEIKFLSIILYHVLFVTIILALESIVRPIKPIS
jgi:hypothetical protein